MSFVPRLPHIMCAKKGPFFDTLFSQLVRGGIACSFASYNATEDEVCSVVAWHGTVQYNPKKVQFSEVALVCLSSRANVKVF